MFDVRTGIMKRAGLFGNPLQQQPKPPAPEPEKRGTGHRVAGYLADFTAGLAGQQGPYAAMLQREQQQREQEAQYQRQRADQFADWQRKQEYERANPTPKTNDTVADYEFIRQNLGDEAAASFLRNKAEPPVYRVGPDGQFYRVDVAPAPTRPVGKLTPLGEGGPASAPGGFRP